MDRRSPEPSDEATAGGGASASTVGGPASHPERRTPKKRITVTFYLSDAMRNRARAAYRHTSFSERDTSWSEMLNKALLAEVRRREAEYNGGKAFAGNDEPLSPGRPIGY